MSGLRRRWPSLVPILFVLWPACMLRNVALGPDEIRQIGKESWPVWPASYRLVQRVQLDIRGRRLDFLGYLAVKGLNWRAVGLTELGGRIFDFLNGADGPRVLSSPQGLPQRPLVDGVMRELGLTFSPRNTESRGQGDAGETRAPVAMLISRENRLVSEITIESFTPVAGWSSPVPDRIKIVNHTYGYSMDIKLIRMDLRPVDDSVFKGDRGP